MPSAGVEPPCTGYSSAYASSWGVVLSTILVFISLQYFSQEVGVG
jgi:hypothetical protein